MSEYRIDELARLAGTTVRNVRAYQERGLLPPPRRAGRVGLYGEDHLARLRVIGALLERGYTLATIRDLLAAAGRGYDLGELLGLGAELTAPFSDETAGRTTAEELARAFGTRSEEALRRAVALGILEPEGDAFRVPSPRLLEAGAELVRAGVPLDAVLDELARLRRDADRIARRFVELAARWVFERSGEALPPPEEVPRLAELARRLRPLATAVVSAVLARAMERHVRARLGERLGRLGAGERHAAS
jgi:DNA-binding transcriptional MerR regulator